DQARDSDGSGWPEEVGATSPPAGRSTPVGILGRLVSRLASPARVSTIPGPATVRSATAANNPGPSADESLTAPDGRPAAWSPQPPPAEIDPMALPAARELPAGPTGQPADPDAALDAYYAVLACLHGWLQQLLAELEQVNGPVTAQVLAD